MSGQLSEREHLSDPACLQELISSTLSEAKKHGASSAEAVASTSTGLSVTVRLGEVETIEHIRDQGLGLTVFVGHRKGTASTSDLSARAVRETVEAACRIARFTAEDPCVGLAEPERMAQDPPDLDLFHSSDIDAEQAIAIATETESAARGRDARITNSEGATLSRHAGIRAYGNTHGFFGTRPSTRYSVSCAVIAENAAGMQRDHWYSIARDPRDLESPSNIGRKAAERTVNRLDSRRIASCTVPVVFSAEITASLLSHFINAIRGGNLYRKASFLLDHLGKQVFPEFVRIHEQPHLKKALGSAAFDSEGVATEPRDVVTEGMLRSYVLNSYAARRLGMQTTANAGGVHNLTLEPGSGDLASLLGEMNRGLLVTELMGMGVNTVTGDYSRGAAGFWVEGGEIQHPVHEVTIASNLREMFRKLRHVANDVDTRGAIRTGSALIEQMTIAGE
jgi:PmbA protein